jgi:hypothetical protein
MDPLETRLNSGRRAFISGRIASSVYYLQCTIESNRNYIVKILRAECPIALAVTTGIVLCDPAYKFVLLQRWHLRPPDNRLDY